MFRAIVIAIDKLFFEFKCYARNDKRHEQRSINSEKKSTNKLILCLRRVTLVWMRVRSISHTHLLTHAHTHVLTYNNTVYVYSENTSLKLNSR